MAITEKQSKCRYALPDFCNQEFVCKCKLDEHFDIVSAEKCEQCEKYKSRYIEYPITVSSIDKEEIDYTKGYSSQNIGHPVAIKPCDDKKTYVGIYLGDLPYMPTVSYNESTQELSVRNLTNPAIFVPELKRIVFGYESWWHFIDDPTQIAEITEDDINNVWYVQMLKELNNTNKDKTHD